MYVVAVYIMAVDVMKRIYRYGFTDIYLNKVENTHKKMITI